MKLHKHHPSNNRDASPWVRRPVSAPRAPHKDDKYFVQTESRHWGEVFTIRRVNAKSFYVYHSGSGPGKGRLLRRLIVEWEQWIVELFELGFVFLNGSPVLPLDRLTPLPELDLGGAEHPGTNSEEMTAGWKMDGSGEPARTGQERRFMVRSGPGPFATVTMPPDPGMRITCSCAEWQSSQAPCSHINAVLQGHGAGGCRILEVLS